MRLLLKLIFIISFCSTAFSQTVSITFRVNMSYQIDIGNFNPAAEFVDIAGTFNNWGGTLKLLSDPDGDKIYEVTLPGFSSGAGIEFKFRINGAWNGREEFPNGGANRAYTVQPYSNTILVWYNDEAPSTGSPTADFSVDTRTIFENGSVRFLNKSFGAVDSYEWHFEGGVPDTSSIRNPVVLYPATGTFDVSLIVRNSTESDTLVIPDYINVTERDTNRISWWNNTVFYEIFVRSFFDSNGDGIGDFNGITQKLDYLNDGDSTTTTDLGITGIWLMPINRTRSYHGYDVTDYRSINPQYGTMSDFKNFLQEAQSRGIHVIIDFVMNHSSVQHPWFIQSAMNNPAYRNFYRWSTSRPSYLGPWGQEVWHQYGSQYYYGLFTSSMPDLNYESPALKDSMFAIADYWLNDIGIDGFRLDAVKYMLEDGAVLENIPATFQFWNEFNTHIKITKPDAFAVGEAWDNSGTVLNYVTNNRLDYCFEFDLATAILNSVNSGIAEDVFDHMQQVYNSFPHLQYGTFLSNHDQNRSFDFFQSNIHKAKIAAAMYLTLPGIPYLYYGEEIGMNGSKPDEFIRRPMQWTSGARAGFTTGTPWVSLNSNYADFNVQTEKADPASLLNWYTELIKLRMQNAPLRLGTYEGLQSSSNSVYAFLRQYRGESVLTVINLSENPVENLVLSTSGISLQPGSYALTSLLTQDSLSFDLSSSNQFSALSLNGYEAAMYSLAKIDTTDGSGNSPESFYLYQNYPNPFNSGTIIEYYIHTPVFVTLKVYDILGREVANLINQKKGQGQYKFAFSGEGLTAGVYFYRLSADSQSQIKKMIFLK